MDVQQQKVNGKCLDEDQDSAWAHRVIWKTDTLSEIFDLDKWISGHRALSKATADSLFLLLPVHVLGGNVDGDCEHEL